jgi:phosphohistidine phosphatase SixA
MKTALLLAGSALAVLPLALAPARAAAPPQVDAGSARLAPVTAPVTVILVRHAEAEPTTAERRDPGLTEAGRERAQALGRLLAHAGATHLFSTDLRRTRETLAPLAEATGLAIQAVPAAAPGQQVQRLRALPAGAVAVVAGHSNTVPGLVAALGGEARELVQDPRHGPMLAHDSHDRAFVVTRPAAGAPGPTSTLELRFGR